MFISKLALSAMWKLIKTRKRKIPGKLLVLVIVQLYVLSPSLSATIRNLNNSQHEKRKEDMTSQRRDDTSDVRDIIFRSPQEYGN